MADCQNLEPCLILKRMSRTPISLENLDFIGSGLTRPECVLAHQSGWLFAPSWESGGGVSCIAPTGATHQVLQTTRSKPLRPNGIALDRAGNVVLAHLGNEIGGVFTLTAEGQITDRVITANGEPLPPTNFVVHDSKNRLWISVSTRLYPRARDYHVDACTGFIAIAEPGDTDATIVADGLGYTNEVVIDENRERVYVNETFARRLTQFDLEDGTRLTNRKTLVHFEAGTYPDGLALATDGSLWVTSIVSNRVIVVNPDQSTETLIEDVDATQLVHCEEAYNNKRLGRLHLDTSHGTKLHNVSNLAFSGPDLTTACLGNLLGTTIPRFQTGVAGVAMTHWTVPIDQWTAKQ